MLLQLFNLWLALSQLIHTGAHWSNPFFMGQAQCFQDADQDIHTSLFAYQLLGKAEQLHVKD